MKTMLIDCRKAYCPGCTRVLEPGDSICFHCLCCSHCCTHSACNLCGLVLNPKLKYRGIFAFSTIKDPIDEAGTEKDPLKYKCGHCGGCATCCSCFACHTCKKVVHSKLNGCKRCYCCTYHCICRQKYVAKLKTGKEYIEPWLTSFYILDEELALLDNAIGDEEWIIRNRVDQDLLIMLKRAVKTKYDWLSRNISKMYLDYIVSACSGELRYLCSIGGCTALGILTCKSGVTRIGSASLGVRYDPAKLLTLADFAFTHCFEDDGSIGGIKWALIARAGLMYFDPKISGRVFIDHVVDLSHNGGLFLGKNRMFFDYWSDEYIRLLDAKSFKSLVSLDTPLVVGEDIKSLVIQGDNLKVYKKAEINVKATFLTFKLKRKKDWEYEGRWPEIFCGHTLVSPEDADTLLEEKSSKWNGIKEAYWKGYGKRYPKAGWLREVVVSGNEDIVEGGHDEDQMGEEEE